MSTKQVGDGSEAVVLAELVDRGYSVSVPFGDNDPYDLLVDTGTDLYRVQVKTGWLEGGRIRFKTGSKTTRNGEPTVEDYTDEEVDVFAVRCEELGTLYWVPFSEVGSKSTYLRVEPAEIDHPSINDAAEFRFDANLPGEDESSRSEKER
jgi:hypothetical protein